MSAFHHSLSLLKNDTRNLNVTLGWLIECRGDNLGIYCTSHIRNLLWSLVDEQHHEVSLWMVCGNSVGNILHEDRLTSLWLCHDKRTLTFTDRGEEVNDTCREVRCATVACEVELLVREEWCEVLE